MALFLKSQSLSVIKVGHLKIGLSNLNTILEKCVC